ncbi:MAG: hypothetical protein IMZ52_00060 [Actinobacteria bacterium]|nr:hypothetical protein [Actinomycetota bacterium]MBE3114804.1 hypothetical protein [Actinomycetota bacterium]
MIDLLEIPFGSRNIGLWDQFKVDSRDEVIKVIQQHLGYRNIGISACAYVNGDQILLFLFFDFDSEDISLAWEDAKKTFNHFEEAGITCCLNFSGRKGWHVIVEVEPKNYSSKQHKDVMRLYRDILGLETLDEATFGDKKRLFRIPGTWNINGTWCRTLAWNDGEKLDLDDIVTETYLEETEEIRQTDDNEIRHYFKPCVEYLIHNKEFWMKERGKFEPSEAIRLSWAGIRIWAGKGIDEMVEEARGFGWDDFDMNFMREKKLPYLIDRKWIPYSCEKLEEMGYCLDEIDCPKKWDRMIKKLGITNGNGEI